MDCSAYMTFTARIWNAVSLGNASFTVFFGWGFCIFLAYTDSSQHPLNSLKNPGQLALSLMLIPLLHLVYWMKRSILFQIWDLLKCTTSLCGCCSALFCKEANCAFKTMTNGLSTPNFFYSLGMSSLSKSISETIALLLILDYWIPPLTSLKLTISAANKSNFLIQNSCFILIQKPHQLFRGR